MTIKEMQKMHKKINKVADEYKVSFAVMQEVHPAEVEYAAECAQKITRSAKQLKKIADSIACTVEQIIYKGYYASEDEFVKWCVVNNIEFVSTDAAEDEQNDANE